MDETATGIRMRGIERRNLRQRRAAMLTAAVLQKIMPFLDESQHRVLSDTHDALLGLFMEKGVEVLTDFDRAEIGLSPRTEDGWTPDEILALERVRLEIMMRPITLPSP